MHYAIALASVFFVWKRGVWKDWRPYHTTILFFSLIDLQYNLIAGTNGYFLWKLIPDLYLTRVTMFSMYVFIIFPCTVLLYLSNYPNGRKKELLYILKWTAIYITLEWLAYITGRIVYFHGWNLWCSAIFDLILFWGLHFHHTNPIKAYLAFFAVTIAGILFFRIPL